MLLKQSTARNRTVLMIDSTDHVTGKASLTLTITASKDGAAFASVTPTVTDLGSGWYNLALTSTHTNTLGDLAFHVAGTGADPSDFSDQVVVGLPGENTANISAMRTAFEDAGNSPGEMRLSKAALSFVPGVVWNSARADYAIAGSFGQGVASVQGAVTGAVASVTARVTANTDQLAGQAVTAGAGVTFPASVASPTNITAGTITTVTNLTNAPTSGDLTATMKTSIGTAVAASAVASVTGNVGGNVVGSVASVSGNVGGNVVGTVASVVGNVGGNVVGTTGDATNISAIKATTDKLATTVEDAGHSPGEFRFSATALSLGPTGAGGSGPSAATIAAAVWDEARASHVSAGTFGQGVASVQGNVTGSVASVAGAVASVTGNVGGSVASVATGGITAASFAAGAITSAVIATDAVNANALASDAVAEIQAGLSTLNAAGVRTAVGLASANLDTQLATIAGYIDTEVAAIKVVTDKVGTTLQDAAHSPGEFQFTATALALGPSSTGGGGSGPTAAAIAGAVWDEALAGHLTAGSTGNALNNANAAGNPWNAVAEGSLTTLDLLRGVAAVAFGKDSTTNLGGGTATVKFRTVTDSADIITATMANSSRTAVVFAP